VEAVVSEANLEQGLKIVKEYLGMAPAVSTQSDAFSQISVGHIFGEIWSRRGLALRDRSLATITTMMVLGKETELTYHINGARLIGVTFEEIEELALHIAYYAGFPVAQFGRRIAQSVYAEAQSK
jgi:alkylhydroperoxidase/carboxymuconolactone decarboxylase family protein YurZ